MSASFVTYRSGYALLWRTMKVNTECVSEVEKVVRKILEGKPRYRAVETLTTVPWYLVGVIHYMEADCNFNSWLHNGDPMRDAKWHPLKTVHVPAGRPPNPDVTWEVGAQDALHLEGFDAVHDWSIEMMAYKLEGFNGYGYHTKGVNSPYLWSMTNQYVRGMYIADHLYDAGKVSRECGSMAILATLARLDGSVALALGQAAKVPSTPIPAPVPSPPQPPAWLMAIVRFITNLLAGWKGKP